MEGGLITYDSMIRIITPMNLGFFELYDVTGQNTLFKSHVNEEDKDLDTNTLIDILEAVMPDFGKGNYKIHFRNKQKTQAKAGLTYKFVYTGNSISHNAGQAQQPQPYPLQTQPAQFAGLGFAEIESIREKAKTEAKTELGALHALEIKQLEFQHKMETQLAEAKRKNTGNEPPAWLSGVMEPIKMLGAVLAAKIAPEAMPVINAMLNGQIEEPETETETTHTVIRTD